MLYYSQIRA